MSTLKVLTAALKDCSGFNDVHRKYEGYTVVILINATILMHKSSFSTNNFGNNHFGKKYQKQNVLRIFRRL